MALPIQTPPPPSYSEKALRQLEHERKLFADEKFTAWGIIWTLFAFKMGTIGIILFMMRDASGHQKAEATAYIASTTAIWTFVPIVALSGIVMWRVRLRSARKKAKLLRQSEFSAVHMRELAPLTDEEKQRLARIAPLAEHER